MQDKWTGRPSDYREEYCAEVVKLGGEGYTVAMIASELNVCKTTIQNWEKEHPSFLVAMKRARTKRQAWLERAANAAILLGPKERDLKGITRLLQLTCRDEYAERLEHSGADGGKIVPQINLTISGEPPRDS